MATLRILKRLLIVASLSLVSCGGVNGNVKVYSVDPPQGLVRKQANEVLPFDKAYGFLCENPEDFRDTITCTGGSVKVYKLKPLEGLVRRQANEVIPFVRAKGYFCVSPTSFQEILDNCAKAKDSSTQ